MTPLLCLMSAIFFEARDQTVSGMEMVAEVVMNRVEHPDFPDDVCDVVYSPSQFSFANNGYKSLYEYQEPLDREARVVAREVALAFLDGHRLGATSTHYHTQAVAPRWRKHFVLDGRVGDHVFYTCYENC
jgi:N-acetylmuramoyl-L-alanine amidase